MRTTELATLALAGVAILGSLGSVLLLAFRVGKLTGELTARMTVGENDRVRIWQQLGALAAKYERHIERHGRVTRD